tara:strand:+ start:656 stop:1783 length:1128 start_codon:yes stop_codon:yes gene_type:complete
MSNLFDIEDEMDDFEKNLNKYLDNNKISEATPLKISIMSATGSLNSILNLKTLSKFLEKDHNICFIDSMFNMTRKISNVSKKKIFYNQITLKIRPYYNPDNNINLNLMVHLKLFRNGKLQLCGLRSENDGLISIKILVKKLNEIVNKQHDDIKSYRSIFSETIIKRLVNKLHNKNYYIIDYDNYIDIINKNNNYNTCIKFGLNENIKNDKVIDKIINKNVLSITRYNITLINSDFYIGFKLNRTKVYEYMLNQRGLLCDFDPCIYQGVLIKFYWNTIKEVQDGKCNCSIPCNGKGVGDSNGECRKITVSVFQSGNIIITGKCCRKELYYIYNYIVELLHENSNELKQVSFTDEPMKLKRRNVSILIKKNLNNEIL